MELGIWGALHGKESSQLGEALVRGLSSPPDLALEAVGCKLDLLLLSWPRRQRLLQRIRLPNTTVSSGGRAWPLRVPLNPDILCVKGQFGY